LAGAFQTLEGAFPTQSRDRLEQRWAHRRPRDGNAKRLESPPRPDSELFGY